LCMYSYTLTTLLTISKCRRKIGSIKSGLKVYGYIQ
jgi:hypothetical protein